MVAAAASSARQQRRRHGTLAHKTPGKHTRTCRCATADKQPRAPTVWPQTCCAPSESARPCVRRPPCPPCMHALAEILLRYDALMMRRARHLLATTPQ
eukprot:COSAG01_NODE_4504_length_4970_cov_4.822008_6_plen_98_part_00